MRRGAGLLAAAFAMGALLPAPALELGRWLGGAAAPLAAHVLVPCLLAAFYWPLHRRLCASGQLGLAALAGLAWALGATLATIPLVAATGDRYADAIWNARAYRDEMFTWIRTGVGAESEPRRFLPQHGLHFTAFAVLSFATVGFAGLALGAALLAYMNFYVGCLFQHAELPARIAVFGWPLYAQVRVVGFVLCAVALTALALRRFSSAASSGAAIRRLLLAGVALVALDVLLKTWLAPFYSEWLRTAFRR